MPAGRHFRPCSGAAEGGDAGLALGNPGLLAVDVGPVIDVDAQHKLLTHIEKMRAAGKVVFEIPLPSVCANGTFVAPTLIEIDDIGDLEGEVFGPVLHVVRFAREQLEEIVARINATGYGLTLGIHSRIDETIGFIVTHANVGNVYVNRNMIGAVVGVQPFGGQGKSGTGPKAGGPLSLRHLLKEDQVMSLARSGGVREQDAPAALQALADWARLTGRNVLAELCTDYAVQTPLVYSISLPGPTGERNTLTFEPRGEVVCIANDEAGLFEQIAAALATGNRVLLESGLVPATLAGRLPPAVRKQLRIGEDWRQSAIALVLYAGPAEPAHRLRNELSAREGARIPLITTTARNFPLHRLTVERVVSVNTTAAGGNASLMTLGA